MEKEDKINQTIHELEHRLIEKVKGQRFISRDIYKEYEERLTFGQRAADALAKYAGSWGFMFLFGIVLVSWMAINTIWLYNKGFDPYPYILLNLVLSCLAAIQAPVIMMSQNRHAAKDRIEAAHDYEINIKAELEIEELHSKLDAIRLEDLRKIIEIQNQHLDMLRQVLETKSSADPK